MYTYLISGGKGMGYLCSKLEWAVILWTVQQQFHGIKAASLFWGRHSSFVHETMVSLAITCVSPTFLSINANNSDLCQVENWFKNYQFRNSVEPCIQFLSISLAFNFSNRDF